jgi:hypothetical protein
LPHPHRQSIKDAHLWGALDLESICKLAMIEKEISHADGFFQTVTIDALRHWILDQRK